MKTLISILIFNLLIIMPSNNSYSHKFKVESFDYNTNIGVVTVIEANQACIDIKNSSLVANDPVKIILLDRPQFVVQAKVIEKIDKSCAAFEEGDETESHYKVRLITGKVKSSTVAIAVVKSQAQFSTAGGIVNADLDGDGLKEYFRKCASAEGLHLTIWSRKPLSGKRIWHRYYYLGYDLESNCTEKEAEG